MIKKILAAFYFISFFSANLFAQDTAEVIKSVKEPEPHAFTLSGYVDAYYATYTDSVGKDKKTGQPNFQQFPTTAPRSNSFGLNMAMISAKYATDKVRSTITLHYGDIVLSTWSPTYTFVQEANAGVRLCKKVWVDAGFFRSHVGTEGIFGKENITSSVAVATFNEPYYEAGVKLNYNPSDKLAINVFLLNGYNIIEDNNKKKSVGMLATYVFNDKLNLGYSNYFGDDTPDTLKNAPTHFRMYHNLFINYQNKKFKAQVGGGYCTQEHSDTTKKKTASMYNALATVRYQFAKKYAIYTRGEIFNDPSGILSGIVANTENKQIGLKLWGITAGIEYKPTDNSYIRIEARQLQCDANQEIFHWNGKNQNYRSEIGIHLGVHF